MFTRVSLSTHVNNYYIHMGSQCVLFVRTHDEGLVIDLRCGFGGQGWRGARRRSAPVVDPGAGCGPARGGRSPP